MGLTIKKTTVLQAIYQAFEAWASPLEAACRKGCSTCCTQQVTITALEGELIISYCQAEDRMLWLQSQLDRRPEPTSAVLSTNEFARACLQRLEVDPGRGSYHLFCPFLDSGCCTIYPARPFGCRSFISTQTCRPGGCASVPPYYMAATTAVNQLIEHLDQGRPWGNLLHILLLLSEPPSGGSEASEHRIQRFRRVRKACRTSQPLPGFLIGEDDYRLVRPLLERIFATSVNGTTIGSILDQG